MKTVIRFRSEPECIEIATQVYGLSVLIDERNCAITENLDKNALNLALSLNGISAEIIDREKLWQKTRDRIESEIKEDSPAIYVACLASYNSGILHGVWVNALQKREEILERIQEMLQYSTEPVAEEWAIHEHKGFAGIEISEYEDLSTVAILAEKIESYGEPFALWWEDRGSIDTIENFEDDFLGEYESREDYVEQLLPPKLKEIKFNEVPVCSYLDMNAIIRDMEYSGLVFEETSYGTFCLFV